MSFDSFDRASKPKVAREDLEIARFRKLSTGKIAMGIVNDPSDPLFTSPIGSLPTTPVPVVIPVPVKLTKTEYTFPTDTKKFIIRCEKVTEIKYNFIEADYDLDKKLTITSGGHLTIDGVNLPANTTIYFDTDKDNKDIEILSWT